MPAEEVRRAVEERFEEEVEFLSKLVRTRSANPYVGAESDPEDPVELEVANLIVEWLEERGLEPRFVGPSKARPNVVVEVKLGEGPTLVLNTHMDTVVPPPSYDFDPYSGAVRDGKLYGVGAADAKGCIAAIAYAALALLELEDARGRLLLQFAVDEESGACSPFGTRYLVEEAGLRGAAAVVSEPYGEEIVAVGHRGGYRFKVVTFGEAVHTGSEEWEEGVRGRSAIADMLKVINALEGLDRELDGVSDLSCPYFSGMRNVLTFPTIIRGGVAVNVVPPTCEAYGDLRLLPGVSRDEVRRRIKHRLSQLGVEYELKELLYVPAIYVSEDELIVRALKRAAKEVAGEHRVVVSRPWNDAWIFAVNGIPVAGYGPRGENPHAKNEFVYLDSLFKATVAIALAALYFAESIG